jgi:endonuclease/exonuclease/phosphatase family metal-dependent hydrolase
MDGDIKIFSWNMCFGCMLQGENGWEGDTTALAQAKECFEEKNINHYDTCRGRAQLILTEVMYNKYDIIALQEATKSDEIVSNIENFTDTYDTYHTILKNNAEIRSYWNKKNLTLLWGVSADINNSIKEIKDNIGENIKYNENDGRPYQIMFFEDNNGIRFIFINIHNTKYNYNGNSLNHIILERALSKGLEAVFKSGLSCDVFTRVIIAGDFNSTIIWKGIQPFRYLKDTRYCDDNEVKRVIVSTFNIEPIKSCCSGQEDPRSTKQDDNKSNDYILISNGCSFSEKNSLFTFNGFNMKEKCPSDHLPVSVTVNIKTPRDMSTAQWKDKDENYHIVESVKKYQQPLYYTLINQFMRNENTNIEKLNILINTIISERINDKDILYYIILHEDYDFFTYIEKMDNMSRTRLIRTHIDNIRKAIEMSIYKTKDDDLFYRGEKSDTIKCRYGRHNNFLSMSPDFKTARSFTGESCCLYYFPFSLELKNTDIKYIKVDEIVGIGFKNNPKEYLFDSGYIDKIEKSIIKLLISKKTDTHKLCKKLLKKKIETNNEFSQRAEEGPIKGCEGELSKINYCVMKYINNTTGGSKRRTIKKTIHRKKHRTLKQSNTRA